MEKKITIKELAQELNVDHSTMLRDIKHDLDIHLRSSTNSVDENDVDNIRSYYKTKNTVTSSVSTESGGVIVRRRRNVDNEDEPKAEKPAKANKASEPTEKKPAAKKEKVAEKKAEPVAQAKPVKTEKAEKTEKAPKAEKKAEDKASPKTEKKADSAKAVKTEKTEKAPASTGARIIQAPKKEEPSAKVVSKEEVKTEAKAKVVQEPKAEKNEDKSSAKPVENKQKKEEKVEAKAQVTSEDKTERKSSASISAKPDGTSTKSILPPAGERSFAPRNEEYKPQSQVRVISKPDAATQAANAMNREKAAYNKENNRDGRPSYNRDNNRDGGRPSYNRDNNREGGYRGDRNDRGPRPQGAGGNDRGERKPFDRNNPRPNDGRNDNRGGFRGNNQNPGGDKDGDQRNNNNRPARPQTPRPRPVEGLPFPTEEQSRKKRNKNNTKTNEFADKTGQQDFKFTKYSFNGDDDDAPRRRRKPKKKDNKQAHTTTVPMKAAKRKLRIEETIRVADMAHQMGLKSSEIIKILFGLGVMATINSSLDFDTAQVVASEFEYEVEKVGFSAEEAILPKEADSPEQLKPRPPVVTIMGHVDHGKTSLLDAIRETNVTAGEAGGITQHIGAYHVRTKRGEIVFLDTPGHEAFTAMRLRGAQVTDIVVLVVAADDGVMEQTREAINHAKAAEVPIIVAVNKMDKEGANPDRVLRELAELGLQAEDWGGDTVVTMLSAKKREGIDELLELLVLQSELMELKANPDKSARGHIVEAKLDKGRGPVATVLIQEGTLSQGDAFVCGVFAGRVRALFNDQGKKIQSAGPSIPVEVQGFEGVPEAGEEFVSLQDEKMARRIADTRTIKQREKVLAKESKVTLETFLARKADTAEALVLNLILKADVQGSLEAITEALNKLSTEKVRISVIHGGAGSISESDIMLAAASEAIVIGFNVRPTAKVKDFADNENVDIRYYDIIYKLVEEIRAAMEGLLAPVQKEVYLGQAEVRETFSLSRVGTIAGTYVTDGKMVRNCGIRLLREGVVIYTGKISSLKRFKDDAKEVAKGFECGMSLENYNDIKIGDIFEAFEMKEEAAHL